MGFRKRTDSSRTRTRPVRSTTYSLLSLVWGFPPAARVGRGFYSLSYFPRHLIKKSRDGLSSRFADVTVRSASRGFSGLAMFGGLVLSTGPECVTSRRSDSRELHLFPALWLFVSGCSEFGGVRVLVLKASFVTAGVHEGNLRHG